MTTEKEPCTVPLSIKITEAVNDRIEARCGVLNRSQVARRALELGLSVLDQRPDLLTGGEWQSLAACLAQSRAKAAQ